MNGWIEDKDTRKGKRFYVFTYEGRDPATGKRVDVTSHGSHRTKREAGRVLRDVLHAADRGAYVAPTKLTVGDYLSNIWLPTMEDQVKPTTLRSYRMHVDQHIAPRIGRTLLQKLTGDQITTLYAMLRKDGRADGSGGLSVATVRRVHAMLHRALRDAVEGDRIVRNPAEKAKPPKLGKTGPADMKVWELHELRAFLAHVAEDRLYALWHLIGLTGMRRGEALALRWTDLDLESTAIIDGTLVTVGTATISRAFVTVGYQVVESTPKSGKRRVIDLDEQTVAVLRAHKARQAQERLAIGPGYDDQGLAFCSLGSEARRKHPAPPGSPIHPDRASKMFDAHVKRSGLPRISVKGLRHSHVSHLAKAGVHVKVAQERAGHHSSAFTLDRYGHLFPSMQREAADDIGKMLRGELAAVQD